MSIEKRLSDLEKAITRACPGEQPLPEATRKLYEKVFGLDANGDWHEEALAAALLADEEVSRYLPWNPMMTRQETAAEVARDIFARLEAAQSPSESTQIMLSCPAVAEALLKAEEDIWNNPTPPADYGKAPPLPGAAELAGNGTGAPAAGE